MDPNLAAKRAIDRAIETGRKVNEKTLRAGHRRVAQVFPDVVKKLDAVRLYDTTHGAREVGRAVNRSFVVEDQEAYDRLLSYGT